MFTRLTGVAMGLAISVCGNLSAQSLKAAHVNYSNQPEQKFTDLTVGDKVPDFQFNEVMNYSSPTAKLSDFKAKLTILDFWSTGCSSCVALFPHMQALKEKFGDQVQIILVNGKTKVWHDNQQKITNLLLSQKKLTGITITLPIVLNSTETDAAFPWQTIPHEVWLNGGGQIIGITGANEVNEQNIKAFLDGTNIRMHLKKDAMIDVNHTPLQEWLYGPSDQMHKPLYTSTIWKGFIDGLNGNGIRRNDPIEHSKITGWYVLNMSLFDIICMAYSDIIKVPANQIFIETSNSLKLTKQYANDSSFYDNVYSYDLSVPPTSETEIHKYVQQDLARSFNISVRTEKRNINCLIVKAKSIVFSDSKEEKSWALETSYERKYMHNFPIKDIILTLNGSLPIPIINETLISGNIDIELPQKLTDLDLVKLSLKDAGFLVTEEQRLLDVAIIANQK